MEDGKLRGAFESAGERARDRCRRPRRPSARDDEPRGLLARLGGERGQTTVEFMGLLPIVLIVFFALWQIALTGYTYVAAGHAAREGARQLAVDASDAGKDPPYRKAAVNDLPDAWRDSADVRKFGSVTVSVHLKVPAADPGPQDAVGDRHDGRHLGGGRGTARAPDRQPAPGGN